MFDKQSIDLAKWVIVDELELSNRPMNYMEILLAAEKFFGEQKTIPVMFALDHLVGVGAVSNDLSVPTKYSLNIKF